MPTTPRHILGVSAFYHDSAAALLRDGVVLSAAQEERFTRKKNDDQFPVAAIQSCLDFARIGLSELDAIVFYDKPITKFARLLESFLAVAPGGWQAFPKVMPAWLAEKLDIKKAIREALPSLPKECPIQFAAHHQSHAASAFYPSPFEEAAIITVDGVGEWATTTIGHGKGSHIEMIHELRFPHSLGLLYSAFTAYCGFRVNSGEYKLMGLAPYGKPVYANAIYEHLIDLKPDGSLWLNMDYFHFLKGFEMVNSKFHALFGGPPRRPETRIENRYADVARSIQEVTEEVLLRLARHAKETTGLNRLCMAGGVALNCVANGRILREKIFDEIWIQPAAGDAGGALGAAMAYWNHGLETGMLPGASLDGLQHKKENRDAMSYSLLGPEYSDEQIETVLKAHRAVYERLDDETLTNRTAQLLASEKVVGWFKGRMEFGPRALGCRSILGDPRSPKMQSVMNLKVKFRESFRPFAPIVLRERVSEYFDLNTDSPYMLLVAPVTASRRLAPPDDIQGLEQLRYPRSDIPAVTHVDYSARIQTVAKDQNPPLRALMERFEQLTGCPVLVNTSFNVRGEPIVCTPDDAYRCLVNTEMDWLVLGNFLLERTAQPGGHLQKTFKPQLD